jgi:hypothetical protein
MKPIVYNLNAFDAKKEQIITFVWNGNQSFSNTCTIRNNATNSIVYQSTQSTLKLEHTIPVSALTNGVLYNIVMQVSDSQNVISEISTPVLFYCYSTPIFTIDNIISNQIVQNSSYQITLTYTQTEGEEQQYFQVMLYNLNKNQIWTSGVKYSTESLVTTLTDLDDNGTYYIRATGSTINGMELDTGYIQFSVNYVQPSMYAIVTLENKQNEGMIKIQSNIISLTGTYDGLTTELLYLNGDFVDLANGNNQIYFDKGFELTSNFTVNIKGYNFIDLSTILQLSNGEKTISLTKRKGTFLSNGDAMTVKDKAIVITGEKVYFDLLVPSAFNDYTIHSNYIITPLDTDILSIWVRRYNGVYEVLVINLSL